MATRPLTDVGMEIGDAFDGDQPNSHAFLEGLALNNGAKTMGEALLQDPRMKAHMAAAFMDQITPQETFTAILENPASLASANLQGQLTADVVDQANNVATVGPLLICWGTMTFGPTTPSQAVSFPQGYGAIPSLSHSEVSEFGDRVELSSVTLNGFSVAPLNGGNWAGSEVEFNYVAIGVPA